MMLTKSTARELIKELADKGQTIVGDDHSFEKSLRMVQHGPWVLIVTTSNTMSLFENNKAVFTILVKDTARDVSELLMRAYEHEDGFDEFEYL